MRFLAAVRGRHAPFALVGFAAVVGALRLWGALGVQTPWIFIDELLHWELAESIARGDGFTVRGEHVDVGYLYPLLLALPAAIWASFDSAYEAAKVLNVALGSLTAVPLYLWARSFLRPWPSALAAAVALLIPSLALSATLMTENLFLPAFVLAAWMIARAVERPTVAHQVFALVAIALAVATRFQGVVLLAVYATAVPLSALLAGSRLRDAAFDLLRHRVADVAVGVGAVAFLLAKLRDGTPSSDWLGFYTQIVDTDYSAADLARWLLRSAGELVLVVGVIPAVALVLLLAVRRHDAAERAFLATTTSVVAWLLVVGTLAGAWPPPGVKERYFFYAAPLLLLALVLWVERGAPRPRLPAIGAAAAAVLLVAALPLGTLLASAGIHANAIGLVPVARVAGATSTSGARVLLVAGAFAAVALLLRPRLAVPAVALFLAASSLAAYGPIQDRAREVDRLAGGADRQWIDTERVTLVNLASFVPETAVGDYFPLWAPAWTGELWNDARWRVVSVGELEPAPVVEYPGTIDWATGRIDGAAAGPTLVDARFELVGETLARTRYLTLFRAEPPLRLAAATEGVYRNGSTGTYAAYDRWEGGEGVVEVLVTPPSPVGISIGPLVIANGVPALGRPARTVTATGDLSSRVRTPFRLEIRFPTASPRRRVAFRFTPAG